METVLWEVSYLSPPPALRFCKKCGKKTGFVSSGLFRVNARQNLLDIWLIYRCPECKTTWNAQAVSRTDAKRIRPELRDAFLNNGKQLAEQYAMDAEWLKRNGAEPGLPEYRISGPEITPGQAARLIIRAKYPSSVRLSDLFRKKWGLSQMEFRRLLETGRLCSESGQNLKKCRLARENILTVLLDPV